MEGWTKYKIGNLCSISSSKRIFAKEYQSSGIPFFRGKEIIEKQKGEHVSTELYISKSRYDEIKNKFGVPKEGDMLLTSVGTLGIPYIVKNEIFYFKDGNLTWFTDFKEINSKFLYYWFLSPIAKNTIEAKAIGSTQKALTIDALSKFEIDVPNIDTQNRIVSILSSLDDKIELNRRINENLEQQAQALFKSWFVDFEPFKDGKFVDSELGMIPEGWRVGYYTELVDIKGGGTPKTNIKEFWNGSIPFFSPKDIGPSCFVLNTEKYITTNGLENCNSNLFPPYSVFITARGTVGKVVMVGSEMAMNQSNYALLGKQNISQFYVYLITLQLVSHLLKKANGAVFNAITTRDFASERIIIPFYSIIKSFSSIVKPIYENILLNEFQIKSLSQLRDTLLPRLMSGELEIKDNSYD